LSKRKNRSNQQPTLISFLLGFNLLALYKKSKEKKMVLNTVILHWKKRGKKEKERKEQPTIEFY
jgi:hypothetical protein